MRTFLSFMHPRLSTKGTPPPIGRKGPRAYGDANVIAKENPYWPVRPWECTHWIANL